MIEVSVVGAWARVALSGEFDLINADEIHAVVADLLGQAVTDVTVDLTRVTMMGAAGLHALEHAADLIDGVDGRMVLMGATARTRRVFEITGLATSLRLTDAVTVKRPAVAVGADGSAGPDPDAVKAVSRQLLDISRLLLTAGTVTDDLRSVARAAVGAIAGAKAASITILAHGQPRSAAISDSVAIEVDAAQYRLDEGPCLDAARTARPVRVDVLGAGERFVHLAPLALRATVQSVLSIPVTIDSHTLGSLNVYSDQAFPPAADASAEILAAQAAAAIVKSEAYAAIRRAADSTQRRVEGNQELNIAHGALAELHDCSVEQARRLLRSAATSNRESVHHVAQRIITSLGNAASA